MPLIPFHWDLTSMPWPMQAIATPLEPGKLGVMFVILFVSLFAVSFPTLSKQIPCLRIPGIVFFIGKHFGTGVILATAFIHLLDDAFRSLQNPTVEQRYGRFGRWTGSIILGSLLSIFLVEYISTSYVEHLNDAPPTPASSLPPSRPASPKSISRSPSRSISRSSHHYPYLRRTSTASTTSKHSASPNPKPRTIKLTETTPLLCIPPAPLPPPPWAADGDASPAPAALLPIPIPTRAHHVQYQGHHHHPNHNQHQHNHTHHHQHSCALSPVISPTALAGLPIEVLTNSPRVCRLGIAVPHVVHGRRYSHHTRSHSHSRLCLHEEEDEHRHGLEADGEGDGIGEEDELYHQHYHENGEDNEEEHDPVHEHHHHHHPRIGRRRQIVGILVLQLGIMIHSLVIGLTLAVTSGSDFTSLTTAIIFHQLFEGLSLGIRIAALPPSKKTQTNEDLDLEDDEEAALLLPHGGDGDEEDVEDMEAMDGPSHMHALQGCDLDDPVPQLNGAANLKVVDVASARRRRGNGNGTSRHSKRQRSWAGRCWWPSSWRKAKAKAKDVHWFKPTLSFLFGVTTPFGMALGMVLWTQDAGSDEAQMLLTRGLLSAISAGMLIYAATVEMIAGDFVFGDVEGGNHHHHHHGGDEERDERGYDGSGRDGRDERDVEAQRARSRASSVGECGMGGGGDGVDGDVRREDARREDERRDVAEHGSAAGKKKATVFKRALALASLFAGAGMMVLVGLGE